MRKVVMTAVFLSLAASGPALANGGSGQLVCQMDAERLQKRIEADAGRLTPQQLENARQQLEIAAVKCQENMTYGEQTLSALAHDLGYDEGGQLAETPQ